LEAWLVTWDWCGDHARVDAPLVAIFSSRRSARSVGGFVEQYYMLATSNAQEVAYSANRAAQPRCKVSMSQRINDIPHGDRLTCGHNPFIYARKVSALSVEAHPDSDMEIVCWKEPPAYKWEDERRSSVVLDREGVLRELVRRTSPVLERTTSAA
jgi:hypothetical protein